VIFVILLILVVVCSAVVGYSDSKGTSTVTSTTATDGGTVTTASTVWTGQKNVAVVDEALAMVPALYNGPPENYDSWYHAEMIPEAIAYWTRTCPGCSEWAEGNLQCVMLITAAYGLVH
jgi:hypothetical protein